MRILFNGSPASFSRSQGTNQDNGMGHYKGRTATLDRNASTQEQEVIGELAMLERSLRSLQSDTGMQTHQNREQMMKESAKAKVALQRQLSQLTAQRELEEELADNTRKWIG